MPLADSAIAFATLPPLLPLPLLPPRCQIARYAIDDAATPGHCRHIYFAI